MLFIVFTFLSPKITECAATAPRHGLRNATPDKFALVGSDHDRSIALQKPRNRLALHHGKAKNLIRLSLA
jgi:hypothetical protein